MPILPLPQFEADMAEQDRETYERLKPPSSIVARFGVMKLIGEFPFGLDAKPGCGTQFVLKTHRGTEIGEMLTSTCPNSGCGKSISRKEMLEYIDRSGGKDYPFFSMQGRVLRVATVEDLNQQARIDATRPKMVRHARELVAKLNLPMKLVDAEPILGGEKVTFYFVSEERIDFREMVAELATEHQTRIEMRQVGSRDEARLVADYEKCGQHCCCKQFLKVLKPVSMKNAKIQKATLDPLKISGRCGRLMCCLRYEEQSYDDLRARLPKKRTRVSGEFGTGFVLDTQILTQLCLVQLDDRDERVAVPLEELTVLGPGGGPGGPGGGPGSGDGRGGGAGSSQQPRSQNAERSEGADADGSGENGGDGVDRAREDAGVEPESGPHAQDEMVHAEKRPGDSDQKGPPREGRERNRFEPRPPSGPGQRPEQRAGDGRGGRPTDGRGPDGRGSEGGQGGQGGQSGQSGQGGQPGQRAPSPRPQWPSAGRPGRPPQAQQQGRSGAQGPRPGQQQGPQGPQRHGPQQHGPQPGSPSGPARRDDVTHGGPPERREDARRDEIDDILSDIETDAGDRGPRREGREGRDRGPVDGGPGGPGGPGPQGVDGAGPEGGRRRKRRRRRGGQGGGGGGGAGENGGGPGGGGGPSERGGGDGPAAP